MKIGTIFGKRLALKLARSVSAVEVRLTRTPRRPHAVNRHRSPLARSCTEAPAAAAGFWERWVTTQSSNISALPLQGKLEIRSYETAWLLLHIPHRAMVNPDRQKLGGCEETVEIDETSVPSQRGE